MDSRALILCLSLATPVAAGAGGIYKCVDGGAVTYQSTACSRGRDATPVSLSNVSAKATHDGIAAVPVAAATAQPRKRGPWLHTTVQVGVTDDEVLNMPGWGRPAQISRTRVARGWEEVWRYGNGYAGERQLRFVNARLAEIVDTPAALAYAR